MFLLFEEDGGFKVGTLFAEAEATVQVEMPTGKRSKIKRNTILLQFKEPARDQLLPQARAIAQDLDPQFLWECAPEEEFDAHEFAKEIFSATPSSTETAGVMIALHQSPMYFYRKGRGRYKAAPEESLKAALAGAERKRLAAEAQQRMHDDILHGGLPEEIRVQALQLLIRPDKQSIAYKALDSASHALQISPARLLLERGGLPSNYSLHYARFLQQCFPHGTGFSVSADKIQEVIDQAAKLDLPLAPQPAYSIDDVTTDEIDDAFSLATRPDGGWRVGIHIAAPGVGIQPDSDVGRMALERASTVYFPGDKITMLPRDLIAAFSLDEGQARPALSLYVDFSAEGEKIASQSKLERVQIAKNLRLGEWESELDQPIESIGADRLPWEGLKPMLMLAHKLREQRETVRGKPEPTGRVDFNFYVDWNSDNPKAKEQGDGLPRIVTRRRGSPVDILVSEFMILANTSWGDMLALARLPGVYRVQTMGRVRMQTQPGPHQGLGVNNYAWSTSPLRRYSDLLNQWQMLSVLGHRPAVFKGNEAELFSSVTQFDTLYNQYGDFQDTLERYWAQRWIGLQHGLGGGESWSAVDQGVSIRERAVALREGAFRLRLAPCVLRCNDAPELSPGTEVELEILASDALDLSLQARFVSVIAQAVALNEDIDMASDQDTPQHYAVLGDPIAHSKSPWIHTQFAQQTGQTMHYQALQVSADQLSAKLEELMASGFGGVNLTVPLKEHAFALAQSLDWEISERATMAAAINTLRWDAQGFVAADNTDGIGLVRDLERLLGGAGSLQDKTVLLIGAGGAGQGVIGPLRAAGVRKLRLANRSFDKAQQVVDRWQSLDAMASSWLSAVPLSLLATSPHDALPESTEDNPHRDDLIINATSASLGGSVLDIHPARFQESMLAMDMMYGAGDTPFMQQARTAGAPRVADGLGMLVEQAAEAFFLWRGIRPETASVLAQCRLKLSAA
jgi:exoribonuclease-2